MKGRPCKTLADLPPGTDLTRTLVELRKETGLSYRLLMRLRAEVGIRIPSGRRHASALPPAESAQRMIDASDAAWSRGYAAVAREVGCSRSAVQQAVQRNPAAFAARVALLPSRRV